MEILAPAGGQEQLIAAVRSGADAVYLGASAFNARRKAENFGADALKNAVSYCHGRGVRVHVTVNTLVRDEELPKLFETMEEIAGSGADAVILQDMGTVSLFERHLPKLPRHASTQMTIHNADGAKLAEDMGFSRVILGRELSLSEIRRIREAVDIELECFIHGALCMSVSGQCLLSSVLGDRSGNRGLCAQPCRLDFRAGSRDHALSLKDACLIPHLGELEEAGVCSLKIEGRLRRPEYVAAAVDACVKALNGETPDLRRLEKAFSRSGFTDGYLTGKRDLSMFGIRTEQDKADGSGVMGELAALYRRERSAVPADMRLECRPGQPARLTVTDGTHSVSVEGKMPEPVRNGEQRAAESLRKTGGTPFRCGALQVDAEPGWMVPELNGLRRRALEELLSRRETVEAWVTEGEFEPESNPRRETVPKLRLRFETAEQCFDCDAAETVYVPVEEVNGELIDRFGERLIAELPRMIFPGYEKSLAKILARQRELGLKTVCAGNLGSVGMAKRLGFEVSGGYDLNIWNSRALRRYESLGVKETLLSPELRMKDIPRLGGSIPRGILTYGFLPLMIYRCCPMQGKNGCGDCDGRRRLRDRQGTEFTVLCRRRQYSVLLNSVPLYLGDKTLRGFDFSLLYFTTESRSEAERITALYRRGGVWDGNRTNGQYYRELM